MGHNIELIFTLKKHWGEYCWCKLYQPIVRNIRGPFCELQIFYWIESSMHLKDFQHMGWRWYIMGA